MLKNLITQKVDKDKVLGRDTAKQLYGEYTFPVDNGPKKKNGHLCWDTEYLFNEIKKGLKKCGEAGEKPEELEESQPEGKTSKTALYSRNRAAHKARCCPKSP